MCYPAEQCRLFRDHRLVRILTLRVLATSLHQWVTLTHERRQFTARNGAAQLQLQQRGNRQSTYINFAPQYYLRILPYRGMTRRIVLSSCVNNKSAVAALINGSSTSELVGGIFNAFRSDAARPNAQFWAEYAPATANFADGPSRQCSALSRGGRWAVIGVTPTSFGQVFCSWESLQSEATRMFMGK